jgi:cyclopropane-fatty-acyl-phospholipid synthase
VHVTGITLSEPQAELARRRAQEAGVGDRVDIKVMDWRELHAQPFDAIASIGMVEHVGSGNIDNYAMALRNFLKPGGRLLNHGIGRLRHTDPEAGPFSERYVFPDGAPLHVSRILTAVERAGLEPTHVEGFRMDYAETLKHWAERFDAHLPRAIELGGEERVRVWRLYLRTARRGFETGFISVFQVLCTRPSVT